MRTWVVWTHYECEIGVYLASSVDNAYQLLKDDWLNDCTNDDCGHEPETMNNSDIASALEYHWDELNYDICEVEVPIATTSEQIQQNTLQLTAERVQKPDRNSMPTEAAGALLSSLQRFREG